MDRATFGAEAPGGRATLVGPDLSTVQGVEDDDVVQAVEELGLERPLQLRVDRLPDPLVVGLHPWAPPRSVEPTQRVVRWVDWEPRWYVKKC